MQPFASSAAPAAIAQGCALLGSQLRVTLTDGRVLVGRLHCIDWKQNILLRDTVEGGGGGGGGGGGAADEPGAAAARDAKHLGLVSVESRHVVRYEQRVGGGGAAGGEES